MAAVNEKIKTLLPYISASDVLISGGDDILAGLRHDEENMYIPIIILLEQGISFVEIKDAASACGVAVLENDALARNLLTYGKLGEIIPELCSREISAVIARMGKKSRPPAGAEKKEANRPKRPIKLELGETLMSFLGDNAFLEQGLGRIVKKLSRLLGYTIPPIGISVNPRLKGGEYRVLFRGIEAGRFSLELGWYKSLDLGLSAEQLQTAARTAALSMIDHAGELIQKRAPELLGRDEVQAILDRAEDKYPVVTGEVKSLLSLGSIRDILRGLVGEQVSIRHIQVILETLADWGNFGPVPNEIIIEQIRQSLKRQICLQYADDKQIIRVLTLEARLEQKFSDKAVLSRDTGFAVPENEWLEAFAPAIRGMEEKGLKPVILCSPVARSWIKEFTRMKFPNLAVLSYIEIPQDINVIPVGEISLNDNGTKVQWPGLGS